MHMELCRWTYSNNFWKYLDVGILTNTLKIGFLRTAIGQVQWPYKQPSPSCHRCHHSGIHAVSFRAAWLWVSWTLSFPSFSLSFKCTTWACHSYEGFLQTDHELHIPKHLPAPSTLHHDILTRSHFLSHIFFPSSLSTSYLVSVHPVNTHCKRVADKYCIRGAECRQGIRVSGSSQGAKRHSLKTRNRVKRVTEDDRGFLSQHWPHCAVSSPMYVQTMYF